MLPPTIRCKLQKMYSVTRTFRVVLPVDPYMLQYTSLATKMHRRVTGLAEDADHRWRSSSATNTGSCRAWVVYTVCHSRPPPANFFIPPRWIVISLSSTKGVDALHFCTAPLHHLNGASTGCLPLIWNVRIHPASTRYTR